MIKKFLSLIVIITILTMSFAGCAGSTKSKDTDNEAATTKAPVTDAAAQTDTTDSSEPVTITTSLQAGELTDDQIAAFEKLYPNITIERVTADDTKLMAMIAAGNAVDVIRTTGLSTIPSYVARGLLLPLDTYVENSSVIKQSDFAAVQQLYMYDGNNQGTGHIYGFAKDWSVDTAIFINKKLFNEANVEVPSSDTALTSSQLAELAQKLTQKSNGKVTVFGWAVPINTAQIEVNLASMGKSLWTDDQKASRFSSDEAKAVLQYYVDLAKEGYIASDANPLSDGWGGTDFMNDKIAMFQVGYWYSGVLRGNADIQDRISDFVMLPSMAWDGGKAVPAVTGGTGAVVYSKTKHPDAVWKFMEWYFGGDPAKERANGGFGIPSFNSLTSLMPNATDFDHTINAVNDKEAAAVDISIIKTNKYCTETAVDAVIKKYIDPVIFGQDTLDNAAKLMDDEVATLIAEGMDIAGN